MKTAKLLIILLFITEITYSQIDDLVIAKRIKINSMILGEERAIFVCAKSLPARSCHSSRQAAKVENVVSSR